MAYDRLADAIIKHAKFIMAAWIVILLVAAVPAINAFQNMSYDMNEMGIESSESMEGFEIIGTYFPSSDADASALPMLVIGYDNEEEHLQALEVASILQQAPEEGAFTYELEDGTLVEKIQSVSIMMDTSLTNPSEDGSGIIVLSFSYSTTWDGDPIADTPELREQIDAVIANAETEMGTTFDVPVYLTGNPAVAYDMENGAMEDISHIDVFTVLMILILVGLFFRSFITSAMPPVTMGVAFAVTMGLIYGLMYFMDIFFITEIMLLVSMMGAGCDYCIFILARYREERRDGKDHHDALHSAIKWAGESITISGASVIIGFGAMSICSFSMISTMGICLALGIVVALLAALTFIPALLEVVGDRIFWPTKMDAYREGGKATRGWFAWCSKVGHRYFDLEIHTQARQGHRGRRRARNYPRAVRHRGVGHILRHDQLPHDRRLRGRHGPARRVRRPGHDLPQLRHPAVRRARRDRRTSLRSPGQHNRRKLHADLDRSDIPKRFDEQA